jgi:drug/metabolite transporter (DMT)-like permease
MNTASLARLLLLSAIWGASFLFMRIGAPVLGPSLLILARTGLAALFLALLAIHLRQALDARRHWRHYLLLGLFNSALPFLLLAHAAQTLSASLLSILNASAPLWATAVGALWLRSLPAPKALVGMLLGVIGVGLLAGVETLGQPKASAQAIAAGLGAALSYGIASTYAKTAPAVGAFANAHGSMWAATLLVLPLAVAAPPLPAAPTLTVMLAVVALGIVCSGVAYLLYFRLIADIGAAQALTVTYLIPLFGILWGVLFLDEAVGWHTLLGGVAILAGTGLATGFSLSALWPAGRNKKAGLSTGS